MDFQPCSTATRHHLIKDGIGRDRWPLVDKDFRHYVFKILSFIDVNLFDFHLFVYLFCCASTWRSAYSVTLSAGQRDLITRAKVSLFLEKTQLKKRKNRQRKCHLFFLKNSL